MRVVSLNQDRGIGASRRKGAAVHLTVMREAFAGLGASVVAIDEAEDSSAHDALEAASATGSVELIYERYALGKDTGARFAARYGIPLVLEVNAPLAEEVRQWRRRTSRDRGGEAERDRRTFSRAARVIAVSEAVAEYAIRRGARGDAVEVIANAVDTARFRPRTSDRLRRELAPDADLVVGFHGRLRPWHGFDRLVTIVDGLLDRGVVAHLVTVGVGDFATAARRLPAGRWTAVEWVPHREVGEYVAAFDVLPLTYGPDAPCYFSPLKLAEAMACGVVPVVPELGDLPRAVTDGVDGLVYAPDRLADAVARIATLAVEPETRRRLAERAAVRGGARSWLDVAARALEVAR